jgi:hypothetical protein
LTVDLFVWRSQETADCVRHDLLMCFVDLLVLLDQHLTTIECMEGKQQAPQQGGDRDTKHTQGDVKNTKEKRSKRRRKWRAKSGGCDDTIAERSEARTQTDTAHHTTHILLSLSNTHTHFTRKQALIKEATNQKKKQMKHKQARQRHARGG